MIYTGIKCFVEENRPIACRQFVLKIKFISERTKFMVLYATCYLGYHVST